MGGTTGTAPPGTREAGPVAERGSTLFPGTPAWLWSWLQGAAPAQPGCCACRDVGGGDPGQRSDPGGSYAGRLLGASGLSIVANVAGAVPSTLLSRYWVLAQGERTGAARQVTLLGDLRGEPGGIRDMVFGQIIKLNYRSEP